jgi:hypothetical protein
LSFGTEPSSIKRTTLPRCEFSSCAWPRNFSRRTLAQGDEEMALAVEDEAAAEMQVAADFRLLREDHLDILERLAVGTQPAARHGGRVAAFSGFREAPIDEPVPGKIRMDRDIEETALPADIDTGHTFDSGTLLAVGRDDPHPAAALGHDQAFVGQEIDGPGPRQPVGYDIDSDVTLLGLEGGGLGGRPDAQGGAQH